MVPARILMPRLTFDWRNSEKAAHKEMNRKNTHRKCSMAGCASKAERMFAFPLERTIALQWVEACGRPELLDIPPHKLRSRTICALHFDKRYFLHRNLSKSAVPTLQLPGSATCMMEPGMEETVMKEEEEHGPRTSPGDIVGQEDYSVLPGSSKVTEAAVQGSSCQAAGRKVCKGNILRMLKDSSMDRPLKQRVYNAVAALLKGARQCKRRHVGLKGRIEKLQHLVQAGILQILENLPIPLQRMLSIQMRNEGKSKEGRRFSREEKVLALSIYKQSPKAFRYLSKLFLLPSIETLRKLLSQIPLRAGICDNVFTELKERSARFSNENNKYAVLIFDELKLSPSLVYNPSMDIVEGFVDTGFFRNLDIADHATVWMLKGIDGVQPWKQPVAYTFCRGTSSAKDIVRMFKELIRRACEAGIVVVATVYDQGSTYCTAIEWLIRDSKRNAFQQGDTLRHDIIVIDDHEIVPLFDPPHLLKCMRNNLLTKDLQFSLADNLPRVAKWSHVEDVHFIDSSNASDQDRVLQKLTAKHVVIDKIPKMKLKYCTQVFSRSVGSVMTLMSRNNVKSVCGTRVMQVEGVDTARFIHFMNDVFDSVNNSTVNIKKATGLSTTPDIWDIAISAFRSMKFIKRKSADKERPKVLQNWIRTLQNFKFLRSYLSNLGIVHFIGHNFNQDLLEKFFGQIRQHGTRNTNPTCTSFHGYYRTLLLNSYSHLVCADINCESEESGGFLFALQKFLSGTPAASMNNDNRVFLNHNLSPVPESTVRAVTQYVLRCVNRRHITCKFCLALVYVFHGIESSIQPGCELLIQRAVSVCLANVPDIIYIRNVVTTMSVFISEHVNFEATCSEHGNFLATYIIRHCILYVVKNYIERVNRVISGSEVPVHSDPLITRALQLRKN